MLKTTTSQTTSASIKFSGTIIGKVLKTGKILGGMLQAQDTVSLVVCRLVVKNRHGAFKTYT